MEAISELLIDVPRGRNGQRRWPEEIKAWIIAENSVEGAPVRVVAERYRIVPNHLSDWRRKAHQGQSI